MASTHSPRIVNNPQGRVLVFDSATYVESYVAAEPATQGDVVVNASYSGVLCARMVMSAKPQAVIGLDCAIGKDGAGIAGLWYYEALGVPAVAVDVMTAEMGNGSDLYDNGIVSRVNDAAQALGIEPGMKASDAARFLQTGEKKPAVFEPTRRRGDPHRRQRSQHRLHRLHCLRPARGQEPQRAVHCGSHRAQRGRLLPRFPAMGFHLLRRRRGARTTRACPRWKRLNPMASRARR